MSQVKKSECTICHENLVDTRNYSFKIIPAKRVPRKSKTVDLDTSTWGLTKFQKYLLKHSVPKNYCEITCGSCGTICSFPLKKNIVKTEIDKSFLSTPNFASTPISEEGSVQKKQKKKKTPKDANAGLIIPDSFRPSPSFASASETSMNDTRSQGQKRQSTSSMTYNSSSPVSQSNSESSKSSFSLPKKGRYSNQKQQNTPMSRNTVKNLQKVLFNAKKNKGSSLGDMLK